MELKKQYKGLKPFKKGFDERRNYTGAPVGCGFASKKKRLIKLIKDISSIQTKLTEREKLIAYQLYNIAKQDATINSISSSINHLYFIESNFGIKIGISKDVESRLKQIQNYASDAKIIKIINFGGNFEKDLHRKFRFFNITNNKEIGIEWFNKHDDIYSFIESINTVDDMHKYFNPKGSGQLYLF